MDEVSLESIGISWKGPPNLWHTIPRSILPQCSIKGIVKDINNTLFSLKPKNALGGGTFAHVDAFYRLAETSVKVVAVKRPKHPQYDLLTEGLFQWKLHNDLAEYGISSCVPCVYDIFTYKPSGDVWFTMEAFDPIMLSYWCVKHVSTIPKLFPLILLQISMILEVLEKAFNIDHRDLKVNNMLIVEEKTTFGIVWEGKRKEIIFPFRIIIIDFGFACLGKYLDIKCDGLPPIDLCPKEGRDIFQVIISLWSIQVLRVALEAEWGSWIRQRIHIGTISFSETRTHDWMYNITEDPEFRAPLCAPGIIIKDCMKVLEGSL